MGDLKKILLNQIVSSCLLSPGFLAWKHCVSTMLQGHGPERAWAETVQALRRDGPQVVGTSFCVWLPVNTYAFAYVPMEMRVAYVSCFSVIWNGFLSFMAHR